MSKEDKPLRGYHELIDEIRHIVIGMRQRVIKQLYEEVEKLEGVELADWREETHDVNLAIRRSIEQLLTNLDFAGKAVDMLRHRRTETKLDTSDKSLASALEALAGTAKRMKEDKDDV